MYTKLTGEKINLGIVTKNNSTYVLIMMMMIRRRYVDLGNSR
jgi:hypothetical protein